MGAGHSRDDLSEFSDSDRDDESREEEEESKDHHLHCEEVSPTSAATEDELADIGAKLESLRIGSGVKLYRHVAGKWTVADKRASYSFSKHHNTRKWFLRVEPSVDAEVGPSLQVKPFPDQRRVDFVANGAVWALRFPSPESYRRFYHRYLDCSFENTHGLEPTDENKIRVFGADFLGWVRPDAADDSIWEDVADSFGSPAQPPPPPQSRNLFDEFEEAAEDVGIQSLTLGAMDNSFLLGDSAIQVVRNSPHGIHGKGLTVRLAGKDGGIGMQKGVLMKGETNMMVMGPAHGAGVDQVDIETGKIVAEWKFEKDGAPISMRDITNESKAAQLDPSESTFLGLDDNRLCRWDVRDRHGIVSTAFDSPASSPVLTWTQGHQFSRGTNFRCFATTGDGSIVVGSSDGKIRLYSKSSMRMAKTAFPGLGSPITHVDVTYDGKWILGTTDTYLILICTVYKDKDGKEKTGFAGRMGNKIAAPRLLKLTPLDSYLAGAENKFHGGQFSWVTENGKQERHLVATVGKFSIIWNFYRVKDSGHECYRNQEGLKSCYCYRIVLKDESIVDSRFMHDKFAADTSPEAPLVVATPQKVSSISLWNRR